MESNLLVTCPHCGELNQSGVGYCEACGMAMPIPGAGGPRVVEANSFATTEIGRQLQTEEFRGQSQKATGALLFVAVLESLAFAAIVYLASQNSHFKASFIWKNTALLGIAASASIFWGLFFWSRVQPLPAAIVGLIFYCTLLALNVVLTLNRATNGKPHGGGIGGLGFSWLDLVIVGVLAQAITAGSKHRKMMQASAGGELAA